jgi:hypothetical protein
MTLPSDFFCFVDPFLALEDFLHLHTTCRALYRSALESYDKATLFKKAIKAGNTSAVKVLASLPLSRIGTPLFFFSESECNTECNRLGGNEFVCEGEYPSINYCILKGYVQCALALLAHPEKSSMIDLDCSNYDYCILRAAVVMNQPEVVQRLLEFDDEELEEIVPLLGYEIGIIGSMDLFHLWINDPRYDPVGFDDGPLEMACCYGRVEMVRSLLADPRVLVGGNPRTPNSCFRFACENGHTEIVKLLLMDSRGLDPSVNNNEFLKIAEKNKHNEIVKMLLKDTRVILAQ